jgi:hypothetical protein
LFSNWSTHHNRPEGAGWLPEGGHPSGDGAAPTARFSEQELHSELDKAGLKRLLNLSKGGGADVTIGQLEISAIEEIEEFSSELDAFGFGKWNTLES